MKSRRDNAEEGEYDVSSQDSPTKKQQPVKPVSNVQKRDHGFDLHLTDIVPNRVPSFYSTKDKKSINGQRNDSKQGEEDSRGMSVVNNPMTDLKELDYEVTEEQPPYSTGH